MSWFVEPAVAECSRGERMQVLRADAWWKKSSRSSDSNTCVEVSVGSNVVGVRDTKDRGGAVLAFRSDRWMDFVRTLS